MSGFLPRLKAVLCRAWGVPPWEIEEAMAREAIAIEDVAETLIWVAGAEKANVFAFLLREREKERQETFERINSLVMALELATDEGERERLAKELEELNRWPTRR